MEQTVDSPRDDGGGDAQFFRVSSADYGFCGLISQYFDLGRVVSCLVRVDFFSQSEWTSL